MRRFLLLACLLAPLPSALADEGGLVGGHKLLALDRAVHDWGVVGQNEQHETSFTYTNESDQTVTQIRAIGDCGCNRITLSKKELKPGESGEMKVVFESVMLSGHLEKAIQLISKNREDGRAKIVQKIAIIKGLVVTPAALRFGDVPTDGPLPKRTFRLSWYEGHGSPFQITSVSVPGYDMDAGMRQWTDARDPKWKGWEIQIGFKAMPPRGMFSAEVAVGTDHPKHSRVTVALSANITGKVWMQSHTLHFGAFFADEKRKASLRFRPRDPRVPFGNVTAQATRGRVTDVKVMVDPVHGKKGYWVLSARVPENAEPGTLDGEVIVLNAGIPGEAPIEVQVKGHVRDPKGRK